MNLVYEHTAKFLTDFNNCQITIDSNKTTITSKLKKIPRTGKSCRIDSFNLNLQKRSLFGHVLSLSHQSELFLKLEHSNINQNKLAKMIAFHDLAEIIIGDFPDFTSEKLSDGFCTTAENKKLLEQDANKIIVDSLSEELKYEFYEIIELSENLNIKNENLTEDELKLISLFNMIDKTDPIIAIWRYLYHHQNKLDIDQFIIAMSDFFENPAPQQICSNSSSDSKKLISFLQNKENAKIFYEQGFSVFETLNFSKENLICLIDIIKKPIHFIEEKEQKISFKFS